MCARGGWRPKYWRCVPDYPCPGHTQYRPPLHRGMSLGHAEYARKNSARFEDTLAGRSVPKRPETHGRSGTSRPRSVFRPGDRTYATDSRNISPDKPATNLATVVGYA